MTSSGGGASEVEALLPLTSVAFEILLSLSSGERHGYAILRAVEQRSRGGRTLHAGTLYRALARLMESGLIARLDERPDPGTDERRAYYRLTELGRRAAVAEARRLDGLVDAARAGGLLGGEEPA